MNDRAIKVRIYPNNVQGEFLSKNFGCCRFVYNVMLGERSKAFQLYKNEKEKLRDYKYKTEKQLKKEHPFLKEADSNSLQQTRRHLETAYKNFFKNVKDRKARKTKRYVGSPRFKSRHQRQSYTTCITNNNIKINWNERLLKVPKLKSWLKFKDDRMIDADISSVTLSKNRVGHYFASILFKDTLSREESKRLISENKIIAFDMSAKDFLVNKDFRFANPHFYRRSMRELRRKHRKLSRRKLGSKNREKARLALSKQYEKIVNQKNDWTHKITFKLSRRYEAIILEDLNIQGMQKFNKGLAKSVTLDFSWNQFITYLGYKCRRERHHLILVDRYFPSSKLCSHCGYKLDLLKLNKREWTCPECKSEHERDANASMNLRNEGIRLLKEQEITIIYDDTNTVGTTGIYAFGDRVRPCPSGVKASVEELGIHSF